MEKTMMSHRTVSLRKLTLLALFTAAGAVISPLLRVHGFAPTQHFINVVCAVFLGPYYALVCAVSIGIIRMSLLGITPLALTGAVFGAFLSGLLYRRFNSIFSAVLGEVIGTGIIGSMVSYPVMKFIMGSDKVSLFYFTPSFILATLIGGGVAFLFLSALSKNKTLDKMKAELNG